MRTTRRRTTSARGVARLVALAGLAVAVACGNGGDVPEDAIGSDTTAAAAQRMLSPAGGAVELGEPLLTAAFEQLARDTLDDITGTARLYADTVAAGQGPAGFRLEVVLDGLYAGGHAWHIQRGDCDEAGPIAVPLTDVPGREGLAGPIEADAALEARGLVMVPDSVLSLSVLRSERHSVRVHRGVGQDAGVVVACAELW